MCGHPSKRPSASCPLCGALRHCDGAGQTQAHSTICKSNQYRILATLLFICGYTEYWALAKALPSTIHNTLLGRARNVRTILLNSNSLILIICPTRSLAELLDHWEYSPFRRWAWNHGSATLRPSGINFLLHRSGAEEKPALS